MKKKFKILIFTAILTSSFVSCTKNLELDPISQISSASYWKSSEEATAVLYGMYSYFRVTTADQFLWGEMRSYNLGPSSGGENTNHSPLWYNTLNASSVLSSWLGLYTVVHTANLLIKYVPGITFTSTDAQNNILAQAHTMRAYCYYIMARTWGGVPLVDTPTEGYSEDNQKERSSVEDIFTFIKKDLDDAISLYPDNSFTVGRFTWSKPAAYALKGDVYLWTGKRMSGGTADLTTALSAFNEIDASDVALQSNFGNIFSYDNKGNNEILFAVRYKYLESAESDPYYYIFVHPQSMPSSSNISDSTKIILSGGRGYSQASVTSQVRSKYSWMDQRKNSTYWDVWVYSDGYPNGTKTLLCSVNTKFHGTLISSERYWYDDYVIYRYGQILLMKAEAKNALGQDPSTEINLIRKRAYGDYYSKFVFTNGTQEENDNVIINEMLLETALEGHYWWDIVRFGKAFDLVTTLQDKKGNDYLLLFPISAATLSIEPKVVQNPGY
jgi:starch-binding outer membrane protein, SusD/RagB family